MYTLLATLAALATVLAFACVVLLHVHLSYRRRMRAVLAHLHF